MSRECAAVRAVLVGARRLRVVDVPEDARLRGKLVDGPTKETERTALPKDTHLLEATMAFDMRIVSSDHLSHLLAERAATSVREIASVQWADAVETPTETRDWIEDGARDAYAFRRGR
jgi:hypothetical protein